MLPCAHIERAVEVNSNSHHDVLLLLAEVATRLPRVSLINLQTISSKLRAMARQKERKMQLLIARVSEPSRGTQKLMAKFLRHLFDQ